MHEDNRPPSPDVIAVVGMAGRFPGAKDVAEFWQLLRDGVESIRAFTREELEASGVQRDLLDHPDYVNAGAPLDDADCFDASFFGYTPREAELMDPQHRLLLECAHAALQDAAYDPDQYSGSIGVFGGVARNTYFLRNAHVYQALMDEGALYEAMLGSEKDFPATRVSYKLNLKGPSVNVQSACSSSGVAIHLACQSLLNGECDMALAGGARVRVPLHAGYLYVEGGIPSPDGHCRAFDSGANGCVYGNGVGVVVLKRLADAVRDRDQIHAGIRATAINNDGADKIGFTAPSVAGQTAVIQEALAMADVDADTIGYVEAHGTGTNLGDPIEVAALTRAFRESTDRRSYCAIGSVKTNIGHLDAGAGVTGVIKTILALQHQQIPASLNFDKPNPQIDFEHSPFFVNTELREWPSGNGPRRAGVSSFGLGGTNFHAVLEEAPAVEASDPGRGWQLLTLSAKSSTALAGATTNLAKHLTENRHLNLADVAYTLHVGRPSLEYRRCWVCRDVAGAIAAFSGDQPPPKQARSDPSLVFMFPGQGAQHTDMARDLYEEEQVFREQLDHCAEALKPLLDVDLIELLYPDTEGRAESAARLAQTVITQPALFAVEYALAKLWDSWGIQPHAMIGHSVGEFVAATLAGVFSVDDALRLVATRARLMQQQPAGSMLAVRLPEEEVGTYLRGGISLAACNAPSLCVVSGPTDEINVLNGELSRQEIDTRPLHTSHAFHSAMMDSAFEPFLETVQRVPMRRPETPFVSSVTGTWITDEEATDPEYWAQQLRQPVRFSRGMRELNKDPNRVFLEVGPGKTLTTLARQHRNNETMPSVVSSLRHAQENQPDLECMLRALGNLWMAGVEVSWDRLYATARRARLSLPTYPFERTRFWLRATDSEKARPNTSANKVDSSSPSEAFASSSSQMQQPDPRVNEPATTSTGTFDRKQIILDELKNILYELSGIDICDMDVMSTFLEMGFDSLFLTRANVAFQKKFKVKITFRQLFEDAPTLAALASYIDGQLPPEAFAVPATSAAPPVKAAATTVTAQGHAAESESADPSPPNSGADAMVQDVLQQQLEIMRQQLDVLRNCSSEGGPPTESTGVTRHDGPGSRSTGASTSRINPTRLPDAPASSARSVHGFGPFRPVKKSHSADFTTHQQEFLSKFIERYNRRTGESKRLAQLHRKRLADPRTVSGFRLPWKELVYPIVAERSRGARIWDVDGNEYVDVLMSFGSNLFGHAPGFIDRAIAAQLQKGTELGPQSPLAGPVADLLCELTGLERMTYCQSGSEAILGALRAARTVTGRDRIALFAGSYHGRVDCVVVRPTVINGKRHSLPQVPGIPAHMVEDVIVLDYGDFASLDVVRKFGDELAAVLVEPVQSRNPSTQPREFLHALRDVTTQCGIALIFDEIITGFRTHPGGAQAHFGVRADLATYGKAVGSGMPMAVLAGSREFLDVLDGGSWEFGDKSFPESSVTYLGGTFIRHPLALASAQATLQHLKDKGPSLQEELNQRTADFAEGLNEYFHRDGIPVRIEYFSSLFTIRCHEDFEHSGLLFPLLREKGVHVYEDYPCFLSTAHTDEDVAFVTQSMQESLGELREAGFLEGSSIDTGEGGRAVSGPASTSHGNGGSNGSVRRHVAHSQRPAVSNLDVDLDAEVAGLADAETRWEKELNIKGLEAYPGLEKKLDDLCSSYLGKYFQSCGVAIRDGTTYEQTQLKTSLGITPPFEKFFNYMLSTLAQDEIVKLSDGQIEILKKAETLPDPESLRQQLSREHPDFVGIYDMLQHCVSQYRPALAGEIPPVSVLFPEGRRDLVDTNLKERTVEHRKMRVYQLLISEFVQRLSASRPLRILEVGAGSGALTWLVTPKLQNRDVTYHVSDISRSFVVDLESEAKRRGFDFMSFGSFDISKEPTQQGLDAGSFDVILGLNVVHATPDLDATLQNLKSLLAPGGVLCLVESVRASRWANLVWGLAEGWWCFDDRYRDELALVDLDTWDKACRNQNLVVKSLPLEPTKRSTAESGLIVAQNPLPTHSLVTWPNERKETSADPLAFEDGSATLPLTEAQKEIWLASQLGADASCAFNLCFKFDFRGELKLSPMRAALEQLIQRHDALRLTFSPDGETMTFAARLEIEMPVFDVSGRDDAAIEKHLEDQCAREVESPFDLSQGPLLRAQLIQCADTRWVLVLTLHHIVCDGFSIRTLIQDLSAIYASIVNGTKLELAPAMQYSEYARWQEAQKSTPAFAAAEAYYSDQFRESPPYLDLPTDRPRPPLKTFRCGELMRVFDAHLVDGLKQLGAREGCSLFSTLLATMHVLLHRLSGQRDLVLGVPAAGQSVVGRDELVGHCVNMHPFRCIVPGDDTFADFLKAVQRQVLDMYDHRNYTFGIIMEKLKVDRDASRNSLFSVQFNVEPAKTAPSFAGLDVRVTTSRRAFHVHELAFNLSESDGQLEFLFWFNCDLYDRATAERWMGYYETLLRAVVQGANQTISDLPLLAESERRILLEDWNDTGTDFSSASCIHQLFEATVARKPDEIALEFESERLTYRELNERADQLARRLRALGVQRECLVGIYLERSPQMVIGILGILKAGGAYVPLDPAFPKQRLAFMMQDSQATVLVTERRLEHDLFEHDANVLCIDAIQQTPVPQTSHRPSGSANSDNLAYVIYTSGSTGKPKGVQIIHRAVVNFLQSMHREPGLTENDVLLSVTTLSFDIAALEVFLPLIAGARLVLASQEETTDGLRLSHKLEDSGATVMQATPATWRLLLEAGWQGSSQLKILCGGEALSKQLADQLLEKGSAVWNLYGPTETTIWSTVAKLDRFDDGQVSIGRPIANTEIYILDSKLRLVPVGVPGTLYIGGEGLARGYHNRPELTAEKFISDPFRRREGGRLYNTGDQARYLADGSIEFLGRLDHQVKVRGFRIELSEIEHTLNQHPGVLQAVVVAGEKQETSASGSSGPRDQEQILVGYVVAQAESPSTSELRDYLGERLPNYMVPSTFVFLDELPVTANRKVDRKALPAPKMDRPTLRSDYQPPRNSLELQLANIWSKILKVRPIGLHDNFFDLGGHSLLAVRVIVEIERLYGHRLPLATLLQAPTIAQFAAIIRKENWQPLWASLVPIQPGGINPALFLMHSHGGNVLEYQTLARLLGDDQPVYGLQARGLDGRIKLDPCLEEMAACYVQEIQSLQPEGPYFLGGYCFGGILAIEAARQLTECGHDVPLVILIQTQADGYPRDLPELTWLHRKYYRAQKRLDLELSNFAAHRGPTKLGYIWQRMRRLVDIIRGRIEMVMPSFWQGRAGRQPSMAYIAHALTVAHEKAVNKYTIRPYAGQVALIRAEKQRRGIHPDGTLGWESLLNGHLNVDEVPGHQQQMLDEPNVRVLAAKIMTAIESVPSNNPDCAQPTRPPQQDSCSPIYN